MTETCAIVGFTLIVQLTEQGRGPFVQERRKVRVQSSPTLEHASCPPEDECIQRYAVPHARPAARHQDTHLMHLIPRRGSSAIRYLKAHQTTLSWPTISTPPSKKALLCGNVILYVRLYLPAMYSCQLATPQKSNEWAGTGSHLGRA